MYPILFELGSITIYSYGFCIAVGALVGFSYMYWQGKKEFGLTFDQSNTLFIMLVVAGVVGGKLFLIFENPSLYLSQPKKLLSGSGFVFYGSLLTAIPIMLWYFKKIKVPVLGMLDVMAIVTCLVHGFGRIGCFMAGCCYGIPTESFLGVIFTSPVCQAEPLNTPLHPTQLYEAAFIFGLMVCLLILKSKKKFDGQIFILYLIFYAAGRGVLELFRGDIQRGFLIKDILSNSQFIALVVISIASYYYIRLNRKSKLLNQKK
ncbi:MAG: prolipoprotein diacylglyceryl transferase [Cyclobacteriaceae bacterium]|jgi:phosphatidylglycerol---prolipoprotein diacylglyceryl transferase|nr:prolipoprotein diacylglyceryl transferase [Cyclobacteriaceae bacterium]